MKRIIFVLFYLTIPSVAFAQKLVVISTTKTIYGQIWNESSDPCNNFTLKVRKVEQTGQTTITQITYDIKNCDGTTYASAPFVNINPESLVSNTKNGTLILTLSNPIRASITWQYPTGELKLTDEYSSTRDERGKINNAKTINEMILAAATGSIGDKLLPNVIKASVTLSTNIVSESR